MVVGLSSGMHVCISSTGRCSQTEQRPPHHTNLQASQQGVDGMEQIPDVSCVRPTLLSNQLDGRV